MGMPEPEYVTLDYAREILQCHQEQIRFLIFENHLSVYVESPSELFTFWGVRHDHPFLCRCKPPFRQAERENKDGICFSFLAVPSQSGKEHDFPPPFDTVDLSGLPNTQWFFENEKLIVQMADVKSLKDDEGEMGEERQAVDDNSKEEEKNLQPKKNLLARRNGNYWLVGFEGSSPLPIKKTIGLQYISYLLERPNEEISCNTLVGILSSSTSTPISIASAAEAGLSPSGTSSVRINTQKTSASYWERYNNLQNEQNTDQNPLIEKENQEEMDKILNELKAGTFRDMGTVKAQSSVSRALKRTYVGMEKEGFSIIASFLKKNIRIGQYKYSYNGPPWDFTG